MDVVFDTTGIVDVDRQREPTIALLETLTAENHDLFVSTVTVAEVLTGANLHEDPEQAYAGARRILGQFQWIDLDGNVAEEIGRLMAYLYAEGEPIGFQDVAIAASHLSINGDVLVTSNEKHFSRLPSVEEDIRTPTMLLEELQTEG